jgi:hypothetical protein
MLRMRSVRKVGYSSIRYLRTKGEKMGHLLPASVLSGALPDVRLAGGTANGAS